jgi:hypothetical protein
MAYVIFDGDCARAFFVKDAVTHAMEQPRDSRTEQLAMLLYFVRFLQRLNQV